MRDLWQDLAKRVRQSNQTELEQAPFGFAEAVLRQAQSGGGSASSRLDEWLAVLRPALGLAFGTALLCVLLHFRAEREFPSDTLTQSEALFQLVVLND